MRISPSTGNRSCVSENCYTYSNLLRDARSLYFLPAWGEDSLGGYAVIVKGGPMGNYFLVPPPEETSPLRENDGDAPAACQCSVVILIPFAYILISNGQLQIYL